MKIPIENVFMQRFGEQDNLGWNWVFVN